MDFRILGPLEVDEGGRALPLGGSTPRALLAALLLNANRVVSRRRLIEHVWGDDPPDTAGKMIQIYVSQLRKVLGAAPGEVLVTRPPGYVLELDPERLDAARFELLVQRARDAGEPETTAATLREALALWRGPALGDLAELPFARGEAARLEELRLVAIEERIDAELELGAHDALVAELEALVSEHPLRERLRSQLMLALYRSGRQAEALDVYQQARRLLVDELGIEPSRTLQLLERAILRQDPSLDPPARPAVRREEQTAAPPEPREVRKTVSVVFADVLRPGERLDPEALKRVLARTTGVVAGVLERHGASVDTPGGGGVMAVFGVPAVHEDDAMRAVRAAVELREAVGALSEELAPEWERRLAVRAGVSTGVVVAAESSGGRLAVEGDAVHEAARLEQAAQPGEILIGRETERLVRGSIVAESVDRSRLGRNGAPDGAWRLLEVVTKPTPARRATTPMVGRERELAQLRDIFERAVSESAASLCVVLGPAGIGKSRLAEEFGAVLGDDATVLSGRCLSYGEGITFWPLVELVREAAGEPSREALARLLEGERDGPLVADRVAAGIGLVEGAGTSEETFWAVRKLFEALARPRPLVVVLDDVHWAEPTLLDLVEHFLDWSAGAPVLLLCLARPELLDDRPAWAGGRLNVTSMRLAPLSESETEALLRDLPGTASLGKDDRAQIVDAAEGNPLFIQQMVAMLSEDGERAGGKLSVPPSIQALLATRLERLAPGERALLERASVVGKEFWRGALVELSPEEERDSIDERLRTLVRKELLAPGRAPVPGEEGLRFRHLLIRKAVYDSVPKQARAELHERFAASLERGAAGAGEFDEIVGYHLEQAYRYRAEIGPLGEPEGELAEKAADRLAAAGRRACARGDMLAGVSLLTRASTLVPETSVARAELLTELGEALREAGELRRADEVLTEAIARAANLRAWAAEANADLLRLRLRMDVDPSATPDELWQAGMRAIELFEELGDDRRLARAWLILAWAPWLQGRVVAAEEALERAIEHARRSGDERTEAQSLHLFVGAGFFGPTPVPEAVRRCEEILSRMPEQQRIAASAARALAGLRAMEGDFDEARRLIEREKRILGELGLAAAAAIATEVYGRVELLAGDPAAAERELRAGYETLEKMGETAVRPTIAAILAEALAAQGRDDEALRFTEISEEVAAHDDLAPQVQWRAARAKLLARRGELVEAERLAREAVALAEQTPDFLHFPAEALTSLAEVLRVAGAPDEAAEAVGEALSLYERKGNRVSAGRARALLAELEAGASA